MSMSKFKEELKKLKPLNFLLLTLSGTINAIGIVFFLAPVNLFDSGFSGTAMFFNEITGIPLAVFLLVLNIPFFIFGYKRQGTVFTIYSIYAVLIYSLASFVITNILPIDVSSSSPFAGTDLLLCAIFGGLISGVGSGLTIRFGGAIDGVEVMSVIFAKRMGLTVGTFVMIYNVFLYIIIGIVCNSWVLPMYSILTYAAALKSVDFIVDGFDKAKAAMIITSKPNEICARLSESFGRGITLIKANGYYFNTEKTLVYFVINRFQIGKLKDIVSSIDPYAYVTINDISDVLRSSVRAKGPTDNKPGVSAVYASEAVVNSADKESEPALPDEITEK